MERLPPEDRARGISFPRRQASAVFLLVGTVVLPAAGCRGKAPLAAPPDDPPPAVRTVELRARPLRSTLRYVGTVRTRREVRVLARVPGTIEALPVAEGAAAEAGAVLARLHAPDLDARLRRLRAERSRAITERDYLCDKLRIDERLLASGAVNAAVVDASRRACAGARAAVQAAEAGLDELKVTRDRVVERAPFAGRVLQWLAEPGEYAAHGRPLVLFGSHALEIAVPVSEADVRAGVHVGTPAQLTMPDGRTYPSSVRHVAPVAEGPGRTVEVRVELPEEAGHDLRHGMSVDVAFVRAAVDDAVPVPLRALRERGGETALFVVGEDDRVRRVPVEVKLVEEGWAAVRPAPAPGTRVVVGNLEILEDGRAVYAVAEPEAVR